MTKSLHDGVLSERETDLTAQIARLAARFETLYERPATDVIVHPTVLDEVAAAADLPDGLALMAHKRVLPTCILVGAPNRQEKAAPVTPKVHEPVEPGPCPNCESGETRRQASPTRLRGGNWSYQFYCKACGHRWREHVTPEGRRIVVKGKAA